MDIYLSGDTQGVENGLKNLLDNYQFKNTGSDNLKITVKQIEPESNASLKVSTKNGMRIEYKQTSNFFRALSVLLQNKDKVDFEKQETALFEGCSAMIDLSRNAVYTVAEMKRLLCYMALAGQNRCYLYMEDTYELPGYPYFGYLRGRYSRNELKQIDDFAFSLGIEAVPCIQTLAHLKTTLKWDYAQAMKDTDDILLVGEDATYRFIETMISTLKGTFRTNKIHIGMDEAMDLGTGTYLKKHGFVNQFDLMLEHLNRVNAIVEKYDMVPIIWDDMFYRSHDVNHDYYNFDEKLSEEDIAQVPGNVALAYWDYYHSKEDEYDKLLSMRDRFPNDIIFAGGIWRWMGFVPMYTKTFATTNAALAACGKHKVKEIMATVWGDDGAEAPIETILPGLFLFGEHCFGQPADDDSIDERCKFLTGLSLSDFRAIEQLDLLPGCENPNINTRNPSKHILYQDLLLGAFDPHFHNHDIVSHYDSCEKQLREIREHAGEFSNLFDMYCRLAKILAQKSTLGVQLRQAYQENKKDELAKIAQIVLPALKQLVLEFKQAYSKVWFHESKGHGFEVIDLRLGGLMSRIDTVSERLKLYLNSEISVIEELEDTLLPFAQGGESDQNYKSFNQYSNTVTQNTVGWTH